MDNHHDYKYLKFISYLQIIGIILVVLGHSFHEYPDGEMGHTLWFYRLLYNVRMPMFAFVSGYLMFYTSFTLGRSGRSWSAFTMNKIKRLLIPYLTLSLVTFVPRACMSAMADDHIGLNMTDFLKSLVYPDHMVIPYFWFLHMSFILLVSTYLILIIFQKRKAPLSYAIFALMALFILLPMTNIQFTGLFAISDVVRLGVYFVAGIAYCHYSAAIDKSLHTSSLYTAIICGLIWIGMFFAFEETDITRVTSIFGILCFVTCCHLLEKNNIRSLDHLQGANYIIFLLSWYVNVLAQQVLSHFVVLPWWIHTCLSLFGGIYIPYLGLKYLQRHPHSRWVRVTAFLLGQNLDNRPR